MAEYKEKTNDWIYTNNHFDGKGFSKIKMCPLKSSDGHLLMYRITKKLASDIDIATFLKKKLEEAEVDEAVVIFATMEPIDVNTETNWKEIVRTFEDETPTGGRQ